MAIFETFSKRQKRLQTGGRIDPYVYDSAPQELRVQVIHILNDTVAPYFKGNGYNTDDSKSNSYWNHIKNTLCREKGVFRLKNEKDHHNSMEALHNYLISCEFSDILDAVDFSFYILSKLNEYPLHVLKTDFGLLRHPQDAIDELNYRFREHGVGYQFVGHELVRVDNQVLHAEAVVPALTLLTQPGYEGAENEFQTAYKHYRAGEHRAAVVAANNAFESTLKAICTKRGWEYDKGAPAGRLLKIVRDNGLYPDYLDKSFDQLLAVLGSGLPTVRNQEGGHGQGADVRETPAHVVALALHLAAAKILYLVECERALG